MVVTEGEAAPVSAAKHTACEGSGANPTLVEALAKAHRWQAQLESGEYATIEDLGHAVRCDRTYVGRILRLTSLAPDIIEAILRGEEPEGLSLEKLRKDLPVRWDEQRVLCDFRRAGIREGPLREDGSSFDALQPDMAVLPRPVHKRQYQEDATGDHRGQHP